MRIFSIQIIYFDNKRAEPQDFDRYMSQNDTNVLTSRDTRKTRLTLEMINQIRKAAEAHQKEHAEDLLLVRKMYAAPPPEAA
jgi:hypothetical protein